MVATRSHRTPLRTDNTSLDRDHHNDHNPTCFQRSRPRPDVPIPSPRKRSNPTSTMRSKTLSVMRRTMMLSLLLSEFSTTHCTRAKFHSERSCRSISQEGPIVLENCLFTRETPEVISRLY